MQLKISVGAAIFGIGILASALGSAACSSTEQQTNTAAAQPVNAPTPTVQEVIDAKKREMQASSNSNTAITVSANGVMTPADVEKSFGVPKATPFPTMPPMNSIDWKKIADNSARKYVKELQRR